ncbi:hypothetical protein ACFQ10_47920 [Streptomyces indonesiensis]
MRTLTTVGLAGLAAVTVALWVVSRAGDALGVRGQAWKAAVDLAVDHPLGVGLGRAATPSPRPYRAAGPSSTRTTCG